MVHVHIAIVRLRHPILLCQPEAMSKYLAAPIARAHSEGCIILVGTSACNLSLSQVLPGWQRRKRCLGRVRGVDERSLNNGGTPTVGS
jgi:hypothetical protein